MLDVRKVLCASLHILLFVVYGQAQPIHLARERTYDVLHYKLTISIDERKKTVSGEVAITLVPLRPALSEIVLDAAELYVGRVSLGRESLKYSTQQEKLHLFLKRPVHLDDTLTIAVRYSASPRKGLYFIQPDNGYPDRPWQVWSQGQAEDNHFWFPCYDYPNDFATSEMIVTVNDRFTAISNGKLLKATHNSKDRTKTYHWRESKPHVSYLISLVVGEYIELKDSWAGIPISYYVYPHQKEIAKYSFSKTPAMVKFFSEKIGLRYPWEKYAQTVVADFIYGGMENVSASTLTDFTIHDERAHLDVSSDGLVAHELAHQWWGDAVTCRDWSHAWLNEGFATYFTNAFQESDSGFHYAAYNLLSTQNNLVETDTGSARRPTVTNRFLDPSDIFDNRIYGKGACILHMLRFVLGDELFWKGIKHYITKHAFGNVETHDFKTAMEEATGYNLYWFFRQWVYQAGYPEFRVTTQWDSVWKIVKMTVQQEQHLPEYTREDPSGDVFITPVEVEIWTDGEPTVKRVTLSGRFDEFSFAQPTRPQCVVFDKGNWILKKAAHQKSVDEWMFQAANAEGIDRVVAVKELSTYADQPPVVRALRRALLYDTSWQVRVEAARSLGESSDSVAAFALIEGYRDGHPRVREAAIESLGDFYSGRSRAVDETVIIQTLERSFATDPSDAVAVAALKSLVGVDSINAWRYCREALSRSSHHEVIAAAALNAIGDLTPALADISDNSVFEILKDHTRYGLHRNVRVAAVESLARRWSGDDRAADVLIALLDDGSFHVRRAVIGALGKMQGERVVKALQRKADEEPDSRLRKAARDAIVKIQQNVTSH
jgi:aminopeptidase N